MKKSICILSVLGAFYSSAFAYDKAGFDTAFGTHSKFEIDGYYHHFNDYENLAYGLDTTFNSWKNSGLKIKTMHLDGVVGASLNIVLDGMNTYLNILGGPTYTRVKFDYFGTKSAFGVKFGGNYNIELSKEASVGFTTFCHKDFGKTEYKLNKYYLDTKIEGSYEFAPNLYAKAKLGYSTQKIANGDGFVYGIGLGYNF